MNKENIDRLKKYLFLISIFFSFLIGGHILYVYLYDNAQETPIEGGSISEGIIGEFPHLNPLLNANDYNKNIIYKLYRSLLRYDFENKKLVSDIASCDIKNLNYIECYLESNVKWSNGKDITVDDIVGTYNIIKNSDINPLMGSLLKETVIESKPGIVTFSTKVKDINFLQIFFQPIVPKEVLDNIGNKELFGKFNPIDGIYSGPYKVETVSYDDSLGIQKLILAKNEHYTKSKVLIAKYIYKIFRDAEHFIKHKDVINVFLDKDNIIGDTVRLEKKKYFLNQYMGVFFNEENIKSYNLRSFLVSKIDVNNIIKTLGSGYEDAGNPFLIPELSPKYDFRNLSLENAVKEMGFYKKDFLLASINETKQKAIQEAKENQKVNAPLKYLSGGVSQKYNFIGEDNILVSGNTLGEKVEEVYINDYKLSSFKANDKEFFYRLKTDFQNISPGENLYKVYFVTAGKKELKEEFSIIFSRDSEKLKKLQDQFFAPIQSELPVSQEADEERKNKILALDDKYYYDYNLNTFTLKLYYIDDIKELVGVSNTIKNILATYGIHLEAIPLSLTDLNKKISNNEKDYDMLLAGIKLGVFDFNIYPYFHSSQSKNGFNFSNVKNLNLDILLEELKTNVLDDAKRKELQEKIVNIIAERQIFKTLYKKHSTLLLDKNIKNFVLPNSFYADIAVVDALNNSYVASEKTIDFEKKGVPDFKKFILNVFSNDR